MVIPFLFHFKMRCESSSVNALGSGFDYDHISDMVYDGSALPPIPAIDSARNPGPITKKADVEKGEDKKDRRMW